MKKIILIFFFGVYQLFAISPFALESGKTNLKISPDSKWLLYDQIENPGLYVLNLQTNESVKIASGIGITKYANWSPNGQYIGFKMFVNGSWQVPCLFDVQHSKIISLHSPVNLAGVPSLDAQNRVAFTINRTLFFTDVNGNILKTFNLQNYANLAPVSPNGRLVAYNDAFDQLHLLNLNNGTEIFTTAGDRGYFAPQWNPNRPFLAFQDFSGDLHVYDVQNKEVQNIAAKIQAPSWSADGTYLLFTQSQILETQSVENSDLFLWSVKDRSIVRITDTAEKFENFPSLAKDGTLFFVEHSLTRHGLFKQKIINSKKNTLNFETQKTGVTIEKISELRPPAFCSVPNSVLKVSAYNFDIPYVHQVFDPPSWFDGHWACGGTSATMCIAYYNILPKRMRNVSQPYFHTTAYGDYVCEKYTYNGFTFDIWAKDRNGTKGYGAYGYIVRNGSEAWADTKGFMAEFARKHGLNSYVDWSPTRGKLMNEANSKRPFVLLNSITQAGHYIAVIGYDKNATTVIVNDPAGNKNEGNYGGNYHGKGARYDWPGYSNGYYNLNTVWCFIYFRDKYSDLATAITSNIDTLQIGKPFPVKILVTNKGNQKSDSAKVFIFLSLNGTFTQGSDWVIDTLQVPDIEAGDSLIFNTNCTITDSLVSTYFNFGAYIKPKNKIKEADLKNNTWTEKLPLKGYPNIFRASPKGKIHDCMPTIKGYFTDTFTAIDFSTIHLIIDSSDVSDQLTVAPTSVAYFPDQGLEAGIHKVELKVKNLLGFQSDYKWKFTIENQTGMDDLKTKLPKYLVVGRNYPNPFNNQTRLQFILPKTGSVKIDLFDIQGEKIKTLLQSTLTGGQHYLNIYGTSLASGIYLLRVKTKSQIKFRRLLLIK